MLQDSLIVIIDYYEYIMWVYIMVVCGVTVSDAYDISYASCILLLTLDVRK